KLDDLDGSNSRTSEGRMFRWLIAAILTLTVAEAANAQTSPTHVALVIGNSAYRGAPQIPAATANAAIVSETMRAAGYDTTTLDDVPKAEIGQKFRDFLEKVRAAGPQAVAFVYFAGHGLQYEGENFLAPIDARIDSDTDTPSEAFRLNDLLRELAELPAA